MQLENVVCKAQERPLDLDLHRTAEHKPAEVHVLFHHGKDAFRLNTPIHTEEFALLGVDSFFHRFPLGRKPFGNIYDFVPFFERFLAAAGPDALFFQGTPRTFFAAVYGSCGHKAAFGL